MNVSNYPGKLKCKLTIIKELLPEAVRGLNAGEASESAGSPCPRPKSAGAAALISVINR